ncbi:MAG TPA: class I SAM-dependent methyltransferase [Fimbriiglobus sp.]|jgi:SAM-dependent methyltransferase
MPILDTVCRFYQRLFPGGHAEADQLRAIYATGAPAEIMAASVEYGRKKGKEFVDRFSAITTEWHGSRVLDFGCASGGLSLRLRELCPEVVGIDIDRPKVEFAQQLVRDNRLTGVEFLAYDGGAVPLPDESFETVLCVDVVEHLPVLHRFVADFYRVLKPGGLFLVSFGPPWRHAHGKHMWAKLPGWWTHLIFPRRTVMRVSGFPPETKWEDLGLYRLTVGRFEKTMRESRFEVVHLRHRTKRLFNPLTKVPGVRELFISEVVGVYRKPAIEPQLR